MNSIDTMVICTAPLILFGRLNFSDAMRWAWCTIVVFVLISAALAVMGDPHTVSGSGEWRGLFAHKNAYGSYAAIAILLVLFSYPLTSISRFIKWPVILFLLVALIFSQSIGALSGTIVAALVVQSQRWLGRAKDAFSASVMLVSLLILCLTAFLAAPIAFDLLGRDLTLTGRTYLWDAVMPLVLQNPFGLGIGSAAGEQVVTAIFDATGRRYNAIDNGYLVLALEMGWLAPAVYASWLLWLTFGDSAKRRRSGLYTGLSATAAFALCQALVEKAGAPYPYLTFTLILLIFILGPTHNSSEAAGAHPTLTEQAS